LRERPAPGKILLAKMPAAQQDAPRPRHGGIHLPQPVAFSHPMPTITKRQLATIVTEKVSERSEVPQFLVFDILQTLIDTVADLLANGDTVVMRRFGTFEVRETKAKVGRNPKAPTVTYKIPARATVKFKPGNELRDKVEASRQVLRERKNTRRKSAS
jgi:nucleoid DNA-binding protein